jgi:hypothetical protein
MKKLPEDFKKRWIEALRSGEYNQQRSATIRNDRGYCCLGVGAVCLDMDVPIDGGGREFTKIYNRFDELFGDRQTKRILWNMNDNDGKSFSEIAQYIEENL